MNRTKGILAAGTLTGLVILVVFALGFNGLRAENNAVEETTAVPPLVIDEPAVQTLPTDAQINEEAIQAWQQYSAELEETVRTMQAREADYQAQMEAANQTILQLQDSINTANSASSDAAYYDDDDDYEDDEDDDDDDHDGDDHDDDD